MAVSKEFSEFPRSGLMDPSYNIQDSSSSHLKIYIFDGANLQSMNDIKWKTGVKATYDHKSR